MDLNIDASSDADLRNGEWVTPACSEFYEERMKDF
jgi:hypothetical protein